MCLALLGACGRALMRKAMEPRNGCLGGLGFFSIDRLFLNQLICTTQRVNTRILLWRHLKGDYNWAVLPLISHLLFQPFLLCKNVRRHPNKQFLFCILRLHSEESTGLGFSQTNSMVLEKSDILFQIVPLSVFFLQHFHISSVHNILVA